MLDRLSHPSFHLNSSMDRQAHSSRSQRFDQGFLGGRRDSRNPNFKSHGFRCGRCLALGHMASACSQEVRCKACYRYGHMARYCRFSSRLRYRHIATRQHQSPDITTPPTTVQPPGVSHPLRQAFPSPTLLPLSSPPPPPHMAHLAINPQPPCPPRFRGASKEPCCSPD